MKKIIALILVFLVQVSSAHALEPEAEIAALKERLGLSISTQPLEECQRSLVQVYDLELIEFFKFLETNFENKSANSSLSDIAIGRFAEYKTNIKAHFNNLSPGLNVVGARNMNQTELNAYKKCSELTDAYLDTAKQRMIQHIKNTSAQKKASIMLEKYQSINNGLRDLHLEVAKMFGLFKSFEAKLPGFLQQCITE